MMNYLTTILEFSTVMTTMNTGGTYTTYNSGEIVTQNHLNNTSVSASVCSLNYNYTQNTTTTTKTTTNTAPYMKTDPQSL